MRGRLWVNTLFLLVEGILVLAFSRTQSLVGSIFVLIIFSVCVQAAEGTCYGIVPFVNPPYTGSISGFVGAGGSVGGVCFGLCFRNIPEYRVAFNIMGSAVIVSSALSAFIFIRGHKGLLCGKKLVLKGIRRRKKENVEVPNLDV